MRQETSYSQPNRTDSITGPYFTLTEEEFPLLNYCTTEKGVSSGQDAAVDGLRDRLRRERIERNGT